MLTMYLRRSGPAIVDHIKAVWGLFLDGTFKPLAGLHHRSYYPVSQPHVETLDDTDQRACTLSFTSGLGHPMHVCNLLDAETASCCINKGLTLTSLV